MRWFVLLALTLAGPAGADTVVATRTLRAQTVLSPADLGLVPGDVPGALPDIGAALGMEARVTLYAGRPIRAADLGPPAIIDRNQIVTLSYLSGPLAILAEGRALARGGAGDVIRVMNLSSRSTVAGRVHADGSVVVSSQN